MGQNASFPPKKIRAIEALMMGKSVTEAADHVGVSRRTLHRWMKEEAFQRRLRAEQDAALAALARTMTGLSETALQTLEDAMADSNTPSYVKVRAALGVLGQQRQFYESHELTQRVVQLERELDGNNGEVYFEEEDDDDEPETED